MNEMNLIVTWLSNLDRFYFVTFNRVARSAVVRGGPSWSVVVRRGFPRSRPSEFQIPIRVYPTYVCILNFSNWSRIYFVTKFSIFKLRAMQSFWNIVKKKIKWLSHHWYKNSKFRKYLKMTTSPFIQKLKILQKDRNDFSILKWIWHATCKLIVHWINNLLIIFENFIFDRIYEHFRCCYISILCSWN